MVLAAYRETLGFRPGTGGHLLRCVTEPARGAARGSVVLAPPFAEEMNKSRRMCARMARGLAQDGWRVVRLDLYGCGDSSGELRDATWARWIEDLQGEASRSAAQTGGPLWIWCVRAGALFAQAMLDAVPGAHLLLWQPVLSGSLHLQQFMRLRHAAQLLRAGGAAGELPPQPPANAGLTEVAGYELPPAVAQGLGEASFTWSAARGGRVVWLELAANGAAQASFATQRVLDALRGDGAELRFEQLPGAPFWQSAEIVENDGLLQRTRLLLGEAALPAAAVALPALPSRHEAAAQIDADVRESVLALACEGVSLPAILSMPADESAARRLAIVIVVGGPQYRVGSHRQFVRLARALARDGYPVLRFDYRGMGDADGAMRSFEEAGADLRAAIDALLRRTPHVDGVALWGLCDAASLILMHGVGHARVRAVALANPWVRHTSTLAATTLKHYYRDRLLQADLWRKVWHGAFDWRGSLRSLLGNVAQARRTGGAQDAGADFRARMAAGLARFSGSVLLLLSADDLTAREFVDYTNADPDWRRLLADARVQRIELHAADHTFSHPVCKAQVEHNTRQWLRALA